MTGVIGGLDGKQIDPEGTGKMVSGVDRVFSKSTLPLSFLLYSHSITFSIPLALQLQKILVPEKNMLEKTKICNKRNNENKSQRDFTLLDWDRNNMSLTPTLITSPACLSNQNKM